MDIKALFRIYRKQRLVGQVADLDVQFAVVVGSQCRAYRDFRLNDGVRFCIFEV